MSDGVFITRVHLPDTKNHHLISNIKQEPQDDCAVPTSSRVSTETGDSSQTVGPAFPISTPLPMPAAGGHPLQGLQERTLLPKSHPTIPNQTPSRLPTSTAISTNPYQFLTNPAVSRTDPTGSPVSAVPIASMLHASVRSTVPTLSSITPILISAGMAPSQIAEHQHELHTRGLVPALVNSAGLSAPSSLYGLPPTQAYLTHPAVPRHPFSSIPTTMPRVSVLNSLPTSACISTTLPMTSHSQVSNPVPPQVPPASKLRAIRPNRFELPPISMYGSRGPSPVFPKTSMPLSAPILGTHQQQQIANSLSAMSVDATACHGETRSRLTTTSPDQMPPSLNATSTTIATTSSSQVFSVNTTAGSTQTGPSTTTTTSSSSSTPDPDGSDTLAPGPVAWGRVVRMADGSLHFPGIGRQLFSNPQSVLQRIRAAASADDSFYLQLPPNSIDFDVPMEARTNNLMKHTSTDCGSRKGFHVCLCCQQTFTSPSLYDSHMLRPLARIFYRCHICRGSETAHLTSVEENQGSDLHTITSDSVDPSGPSGGGPNLFTSGSVQQLPSHSPYCTVLFGGIVKAFNRCAVYSHFAYAHPNEVDLWKLQPSRISVCPMAESAWESTPIELLGADPVIATCITGINSTRAALPLSQCSEVDPTRQHTSPPPPPPTGTPESAVISDDVSDDGTTHPANKLDAAASYRPGIELIEVWNDLEQAINEAILHHGLNFLSSSDRFIDLSGVSSTLTASSSLVFDARHSTVANSSALQRIYTSTSDSTSSPTTTEPSLPPPTSSLAETILHLARAPVWYSHLFLTDWSQNYQLITKSSNEPEKSKLDELIIDEDHRPPQQLTEEKRVDCVKRLENKIKHRPIAPPPVPSNNELHDVLLNLVHSSRCSTPHTPDQTTTLRLSSETIIPTSEPSSASDSACTKSASSLPSDVTERGFLRCLLCPFQTNHPDRLAKHLTGSQNNVPTKCALCGQSVRIQQPALCAAKAHLLLHLGYYIMCPNCGFTPPPHLAPDAAELCLRIHLRFVCFHFNLLQVFVCSRCQHGRGKAYNTMAHLCQHIYDSHTQRLHLCLWCARQSSQDSNIRSASTGALTNNDTETGSTAATRSSDPVEHNGVHNEPSQTQIDGSSVSLDRSAPRFLTPKELLNHLRQVHKHVLILPPTEYLNNGHDTVDQNPVGLSHGKQSQQHPMRNGYSSESVDATNEEIRNRPSPAGAKSRVLTVDSPMPEQASNQLIHLVPAVDFIYVHCCPDCDEAFETREAFAQHFRTSHYSNCSGVCCYRCFGSCKRLSFDLAEFHEHLVTCSSAREFFVATFAPGRTSTTRSASHPDHRPLANDGTSLRGNNNPLCFCLHCGIGARRLGPQPRLSGEDESCIAKGSTASVDEGSVSDPPPGASQAIDTTASLPTASKEPLYDPRYFPDLHSVHNHEAQFHFTPTNSQIACPWCGRRLSCNKTEDMRLTVHHLKSHMKRHAFASWNLDRTRKWNRNAKALSHCICGAALLDSPLALLSHASSHLLVSRSGKLTSTLSNRLFVAEGGAPHLIRLQSAPSSSDVGSTNDRPSAALATSNTSSSLRRLQRPSPGAHIPCMTDVYHHLRFAVAPELDHYLDHASLVSDPFVCPLCSVRVSTRWALSEHAFVEHWGFLCFICCLVPSSSFGSRKDLGKKPSLQQVDDRPPTEEPLPTTVPELPDPSNAGLSPTNTAVTCPASTSPVPPTETGMTKSISAPNIWEHIHQCMSERSRLLQAGQFGIEQESTMGTRIRGAATSSGSDEGGTTWCRSNPRLKRSSGQSDSSTKTFKRFCDDALLRIDRADPIVIVSSPELSPRSERTSVTVEESDNTTGSQPAKHGRRLVIADVEDNELGDKPSIQEDSGGSHVNDRGSSNPAELINGDAATSPSQTFSTQHLELNDMGSTGEPSSLLCVICGEQQTLDTWEDHSLSHRNPQMPWNGLQLSDPLRLVLMHRQPKIYKCYVCDRRFVTRFGCQRHMTGRHKMAKSRISWDLLIQSSSSAQGNKSPERPCTTVARKSSMSSTVRHLDQPPPPPPPPYPKSSMCISTTPSTVDSSPGSIDSQQPSTIAGRSSELPVEGATSEPQQQLHYCTVCRIPFMSQLSFSIHKAAAHSNS